MTDLKSLIQRAVSGAQDEFSCLTAEEESTLLAVAELFSGVTDIDLFISKMREAAPEWTDKPGTRSVNCGLCGEEIWWDDSPDPRCLPSCEKPND